MQIGTTDVKSFLKFYDKLCEKQHTMRSNDFAVFMAKECAEYITHHPKTSVMLIGTQLHLQGRNNGPP